MYRKILLALDGSPLAEGAIPAAARLALGSGATLYVALVHEWASRLAPLSAGPLTIAQIDAAGREAGQAYLDRVTAEIAAAHGIRVSGLLLEGLPADALAQYARTHQMDLVVLTTHGRGGLSRLWLGSVADALLRQLRQPALLCRPSAGAPACTLTLARLVVALDGSAGGERALKGAVDLAESASATPHLSLLMVVSPTLVFPELGAAALGAQLLTVEERRAQASAYLDRWERRLATRGIAATVRVEVEDEVAPAILRVAQEEAADAIVVASRAQAGMRRMLMGSVADKVIRGSSLPVLVCRTPARTWRAARGYRSAARGLAAALGD